MEQTQEFRLGPSRHPRRQWSNALGWGALRVTDRYFGSHEFRGRKEAVQTSSERSFGLVFAVVFAVVGLFNLHGAGSYWPYWLGAAALFVLLALAAPRVLAPPDRLWAKFGLLLHRMHQPRHPGDPVLRLHHADRISDAAHRKRPTTPPFRSGHAELLDCSRYRRYPVVQQPVLRGSDDRIPARVRCIPPVRKKFWLLPIFIVMAMFGGLIVLTQGSAVAPFIYTIF